MLQNKYFIKPHIRGVLFIELQINLIGGNMKKYICFLLTQISFSQINPGEVIWEENFDNLDNWIIETGQNDERRLIGSRIKKNR